MPAKVSNWHLAWQVEEHTDRFRPQLATLRISLPSPLQVAKAPPHWAAQVSTQLQAAAHAWEQMLFCVAQRSPNTPLNEQAPLARAHCPLQMSVHGEAFTEKASRATAARRAITCMLKFGVVRRSP
ncbi:hypothetical protein EGW08_017477 [Elysia chlorotica]|uniref:Uncharacterized protein n=1 Tax=Elysia chlorotica TaxID=188477 RepID=A0A433SZM2_ELYCH|nr:hypothetical protein EGW08_017477 [Elysia chlorotica]